MRVDDPLPFSEGKAHFTCGPSRTEAEHPQPGFSQVGFTSGAKCQVDLTELLGVLDTSDRKACLTVRV